MTTKKKKKKTKAFSKMSDKELRKEASLVAATIATLNNTLRSLTFEMGVRSDKLSCRSEDPTDMCAHCTCWKMTRARCT